MITADELAQKLMDAQIAPWMLLLALFLMTFVLEDVATLAGAYLAAEEMVSIPGALVALIIGVLLGDWALYGLGRVARRNKRLDRWISDKDPKRLIEFLGNHIPSAVVIARILPGTRLTGYTAMGFLGINFTVYAISCFFCVIAWTAFLFSSGYGLGTWSRSLFGEHHLIGFAIFIVLFLLLIRFILARLKAAHVKDKP